MGFGYGRHESSRLENLNHVSFCADHISYSYAAEHDCSGRFLAEQGG